MLYAKRGKLVLSLLAVAIILGTAPFLPFVNGRQVLCRPASTISVGAGSRPKERVPDQVSCIGRNVMLWRSHGQG
jgi:hypothetical protein